MEPLSLEEEAQQPLEGVLPRAITAEAAGAPSAAGGRCSYLSESAQGMITPLPGRLLLALQVKSRQG